MSERHIHNADCGHVRLPIRADRSGDREPRTAAPWFVQGTLIHGPDTGGIDIGPLIGEMANEADAAYIIDIVNRAWQAAQTHEPALYGHFEGEGRDRIFALSEETTPRAEGPDAERLRDWLQGLLDHEYISSPLAAENTRKLLSSSSNKHTVPQESEVPHE